MRLDKNDEKRYPKLYKYVREALPQVVKIPRIVKALERNGELKKQRLKTVLKYGTGPMIKVTPLADACGEFTPDKKSNELRIHKALVEKFEKNPSNENTLLLGATILHELAHWGDDQDGKDLPNEEGESYEKSAYGRVIFCPAF